MNISFATPERSLETLVTVPHRVLYTQKVATVIDASYRVCTCSDNRVATTGADQLLLFTRAVCELCVHDTARH